MTADDSRAVPDTEALAQRWATRSAELLADWQDYDSHDGHARRGEGIAYSDAAAELRAALARDVGTPERADAVTALRELVELKDGPRDDRYRARKDWAWTQARAVLARDVPAGRDLTAQDVREALGAGLMPQTPHQVADRLNRIARGGQR